jgi:hypothetical protein
VSLRPIGQFDFEQDIFKRIVLASGDTEGLEQRSTEQRNGAFSDVHNKIMSLRGGRRPTKQSIRWKNEIASALNSRPHNDEMKII